MFWLRFPPQQLGLETIEVVNGLANSPDEVGVVVPDGATVGPRIIRMWLHSGGGGLPVSVKSLRIRFR